MTSKRDKDWPDMVVIHLGCNDITHSNVDDTNIKYIRKRWIEIGKSCKFMV